MEDNKLVITKPQANEIQLIARDLAQRLKYMIVNGNKLSDNEVYSLAQYAAANGLNPFAGECYYLPGIGPCPGVAGWRSKAQNQLDFEAKEAGLSGGNIWYEYFHAKAEDCAYNPEKDIVYKVVQHDTVSFKRWRDSIMQTSDEFMKMGAGFSESYDKAREITGPEPVTVSWGGVFASEHFGNVEKYDRHERAKKRGEKLCLRKRFPRINLPEPEKYERVIDDEDFRVVMIEEPNKDFHPLDSEGEKKCIASLGFRNDMGDLETKEEKAVDETLPTPAQADRPYSPEALIERLQVMEGSFLGKTCTEGDRTSVRLNLTTMAGGIEEQYRDLLMYLVGFQHLNEVPDGTILALKKWIHVTKQDDGTWIPDDFAIKEAKAVMEMLKPGQETLL
jgi:hypothetical protein